MGLDAHPKSDCFSDYAHASELDLGHGVSLMHFRVNCEICALILPQHVADNTAYGLELP